MNITIKSYYLITNVSYQIVSVQILTKYLLELSILNKADTFNKSKQHHWYLTSQLNNPTFKLKPLEVEKLNTNYLRYSPNLITIVDFFDKMINLLKTLKDKKDSPLIYLN